jgi:hypothetical protein
MPHIMEEWMRIITAIVNDSQAIDCNPLMYVVRVPNQFGANDVLDAVAMLRGYDTDQDVDKDDLTLLLAFEGEPKLAADWRD